MKSTHLTSAIMLATASLTSNQAFALIELEHNQAKQLVNDGKILSLDLTLVQVQDYCSGKLVDAHLYQAHGQWHYDLQIKSIRGQLISLQIDAVTGLHRADTPLPETCIPHKK